MSRRKSIPKTLRDKIITLDRHYLSEDDPWGLFEAMVELDDVLCLIEQETCDHKFVDSSHCLKCGWTPPPK